MTDLSGWGRFPRIDGRRIRARAPEDVAAAIARGALIARGNGRSYGDSAANPAQTLDMRRMDRMLAFDPATGRLEAEAGVMLSDIIATFLPRGWFPAVTPGTKFVTLGGAIAADVHGKNHHSEGSFAAFTDWIDLMGPDGAVRRCSREENADLFGWTLGGMGLTGVILRAAIRLRRVETAWIRQTTIAAPDLSAAMDAFEANMGATYSVAWIDCVATGAHLGRSLVMLGEHARVTDLPARRQARPFESPRHRAVTFPFDAPGFALNRVTVRAFNAAYYTMGARKTGARLVDWDSYFYPLDAVLRWNRLYGRRGFVQFQCVIPTEAARAGMTRLMEVIAASGAASFLSVLKRFGPQESRIAFPAEGYTLALDFPATRAVLDLLPELDAITLDHGGRFYLAKDARLPAATFAAADARVAGFAAMRRAAGLSGAFASVQSERLGL